MSKRYRQLGEMEDGVDTARVLMLLSQQQHGAAGDVQYGARQVALGACARARRVFECKTCTRRFPTFQALGGHRASHRRRPRPRAHRALGDDDVIGGANGRLSLGLQPLEARGGTAAGKVHGCPVCGIEFAVGQALGGHMRRHRAAAADADAGAHGAGEAKTSVEVDDVGGECTGGVCLDLNLAPSECAKCGRNAGLGAAARSVQRTLLFGCSL